MFAALNVALPLVGVRPILALEGSAALAVLALMPAMRRGGAVPWREAHARAALLACLAMALVWYARAVVPPAPLFLARTVAARAVTGLTPVDVIQGSVPAATVRNGAGWPRTRPSTLPADSGRRSSTSGRATACRSRAFRSRPSAGDAPRASARIPSPAS